MPHANSALRHENDVGAAAVLGLALFRLLGKLESGDLSGLADGKLGSQDVRGRERHHKPRVGVFLYVATEMILRRSLADFERIALVFEEQMNLVPIL